MRKNDVKLIKKTFHDPQGPSDNGRYIEKKIGRLIYK